MEEMEIKKFDRILLKGSPVLFTGAGFSKYAQNGDGENIPDGTQLKRKLLTELLFLDEAEDDYNELINYSLSDLCSYCEQERGSNNLKDFLVSTLSGCTPKKFHKIIANYPWKKVYTTNIDDLFENSRTPGSLAVQNLTRIVSYTRAKSIEYIKLHGCVRNPSGSIVFSRQDYVDSMLNSTDYRFSSFATDIQRENFVFLGFGMDEINLDYYLELYKSVQGRSSNGKLYFISPNPGLIFKSKIKKINGHIIEWTSEEFANHLQEIMPKDKDVFTYKNQIDGFRFLETTYESEKIFKGYNSDLYFGKYPLWKDIFFDWDFINPQISSLVDSILKITSNTSKNLIATIVGKAISGKTVYLKRIGLSLLKEGFAVYDFDGRRFDYWAFLQYCKKIDEARIVLLVDNASFFYSALKNLLNKFPSRKQIIIIATSRPYFHNRKRYNLISENNFIELNLGENMTTSDRLMFSQNIAKKLDDKGFLGNLKADSYEERVRKINKKNDVGSLLYSITFGNGFIQREMGIYGKIQSSSVENKEELNVLKVLAIFQKVDLPYLPLELLALWYTPRYNDILERISDLVNISKENNGLYLRNNILTNTIIRSIATSEKSFLIKEILMFVSPQITDSVHSYWNEIQSTLMKVKLLKNKLHMSNSDIKNLLFDIKNYYNDDFNYWLQVGLVEQSENDFEKALNRFTQADALSDNSYVVQNAIARNYLRYANYVSEEHKAKELFHEGAQKMLKLINSRDEYQVKAFSTHCYIFEQIRFWRKFKIIPTKSDVEKLFVMLKTILDVDGNDPMAKHISNVLFKFIHESKIQGVLSEASFYDLGYLKEMFSDYSTINIEKMLEDFEID